MGFVATVDQCGAARRRDRTARRERHAGRDCAPSRSCWSCIELFAFVRSPLRFGERLAAHRLGYAAVTRWRRWLVLVVGQLNYSQWRTYASGDLLERALGDTDELQDLWLRFVIPFVDVIAVMVASDVVVAILPPHGHWWTYAVNLAVLQLIGVGRARACSRAASSRKIAIFATREVSTAPSWWS